MAVSEVAGEDVVALFMLTTVREIITTRLTRITSSSPSILIFTSCLSILVTFYCCKNLVYFNCFDGICLLLPSEINYCELILYATCRNSVRFVSFKPTPCSSNSVKAC